MFLQILKYVAGAATILTGATSLFRPKTVLNFTGLSVSGGRGVTEIRTILGALFVAVGAAAIYFNMPQTYQMLGITYLGMALVRLVSIFVDNSAISSNIISLVVELVFGIILVL